MVHLQQPALFIPNLAVFEVLLLLLAQGAACIVPGRIANVRIVSISTSVDINNLL